MQANYLKYSLGIDVSKDENQVCLSVIDDRQKVTIKGSRKFPNTLKGFEGLDHWITKHMKLDIPLFVALEATGIYHEQLLWFLYEKDYQLSVILPNKAKNYLKAVGLKSKNDSIDAAGLARMGAEQNLPLWKPCSKQLLSLKMLTRHYERLQNLKNSMGNQLHALNHAYEAEKMVVSSLERLLKDIDKQIQKTEQQIEAVLEKDPALYEKVEMIASSIKGLGIKTVATIIAETDGFSNIRNQRQLTSYAGYDVVENQSGKRAGKTKISKKGNSHIRRALYLPALNMVRYEVKPFLALYHRIYQRSGIKMKAYTAIQRKLLLLIYTLWRKDEKYNQKYYETPGNDHNNQGFCAISGNDEPKLLFSLGSEGDTKIAPANARATQDELPCNESPARRSAEVLFSLQQS
jgi:transposase